MSLKLLKFSKVKKWVGGPKGPKMYVCMYVCIFSWLYSYKSELDINGITTTDGLMDPVGNYPSTRNSTRFYPSMWIGGEEKGGERREKRKIEEFLPDVCKLAGTA